NDLTVSKTATTSFARTDKWSITKTVAAPTTVTVPYSGSASFRYTVNVAAAGSVDSGWLVTGTIKVSNPNDWDALTANVTDTVNNGGVCTVKNGTGVSIPARGSVTLDYRCVYASAPAPAVGSNTATV